MDIITVITDNIPNELNTDKQEILSLFDLMSFIKTILSRWKHLLTIKYSDIPEKNNRISISLLIFTLVMLYPVIIRFIFGLLGFIVSYQLYSKYGAAKTGDPAFGMLKFKDWIHIHHWMYCTIFVILICLFGLSHPFLLGLGFGGITHGIQYSDWHVIVDNLKK